MTLLAQLRVGWGKLAEELQNTVQVNSKLVIEGRLRMNTIPRQDGTKEKQAEFTLSRIHPFLLKQLFINTFQNLSQI